MPPWLALWATSLLSNHKKTWLTSTPHLHQRQPLWLTSNPNCYNYRHLAEEEQTVWAPLSPQAMARQLPMRDTTTTTQISMQPVSYQSIHSRLLLMNHAREANTKLNQFSKPFIFCRSEWASRGTKSSTEKESTIEGLAKWSKQLNKRATSRTKTCLASNTISHLPFVTTAIH